MRLMATIGAVMESLVVTRWDKVGGNTVRSKQNLCRGKDAEFHGKSWHQLARRSESARCCADWHSRTGEKLNYKGIVVV